MTTRPSADTLGDLFVDEIGVVWQHVAFTDQPTASFRRVDDSEQRLGGVIGSPLLADLRLLTPEPQ